MSLKLLLNTQIIWMIFIKILKNTFQMKNEKYWLYMVIWLLICLVIIKLNPLVIELFIRQRKLIISLVFITQSHFSVPKFIRLNSTNYLIMKIRIKSHLQQTAFSHSSDIDFHEFIKLYKKCTEKPYFVWLLILFLHQIILHVSERIF